MNEIIEKAREFMKAEKVDFLLVNSTNEFLVEYNRLSENARYLLTGFSGSTGDALLSRNKLYLFVDGRYHIQADLETDPKVVTVVKLQTGQSQLCEMAKLIPHHAVVGVCGKKNSQKRLEEMEKHFKVKLLDFDGIETDAPDFGVIEDLSECVCGQTSEEKIRQIQKTLDYNESIFFTNPEDVSYLYNKRDFSKPYSSKILAKALITSSQDIFFSEEKQKNFDKYVSSDIVYVDANTITAHDYLLLGRRARIMKENPVQAMRTVKNDTEIAHLKTAFERTDMALRAIRDYIENNDGISEYDIDQKLEEYFKQFGAKSLSFKSIVAHNQNSALAHYSKSSKEEIIKDGSLILIDCGAYYEGGLATDITRVFVKGTPTTLQRKVYTTVLKTFLNAFNYPITTETTGYEIDNLARTIFEKNKIEGFVFNHGLGHGIGINVHEAPPNLGCGEIAKTSIKENMCFTIEPGLYNKDYFGVRLENSCYFKDGKINSFTSMCYEKKLIDYSILTEQEQEWLGQFEVR